MSEMSELSQIERRNKRYAARVEQSFSDGQLHCPRKGPLRPAISVVSCLSLHARDPDECTRCACRQHLVAGPKLEEIKKVAASAVVPARKELR